MNLLVRLIQTFDEVLGFGLVQRFTVVDNSDISPSGLTVPSDSPYDKETLPATHFK